MKRVSFAVGDGKSSLFRKDTLENLKGGDWAKGTNEPGILLGISCSSRRQTTEVGWSAALFGGCRREIEDGWGYFQSSVHQREERNGKGYGWRWKREEISMEGLRSECEWIRIGAESELEGSKEREEDTYFGWCHKPMTTRTKKTTRAYQQFR